MGSENVDRRKVILGRAWAKMDFLEKMGVVKGHLGRNRRFLVKVGLLRENRCGKGTLW